MKLKKINKKPLRLALDGFSASGKSLGAKLISKKYKLNLLNSGLLYRFAAYLILKHQPRKKNSFLKKKFKKINYKNLSLKNLHTQEISNYASIIAKKKKIRIILIYICCHILMLQIGKSCFNLFKIIFMLIFKQHIIILRIGRNYLYFLKI